MYPAGDGRFRTAAQQVLLAIAFVPLIGALTWASLVPARQLRSGEALGYEAALGAGTAAAAWLAVLWFIGCLALALLSRVPGVAGRSAQRLAHRVTPTLVRRLLEAGLGATLVVTTTAQAGHASTAAAPLSAGRESAGSTANGATAHPKLPRPDRPATSAAKPEREKDRSPVVRVRPGDTLWDIAADELPGKPSARAIAAEWPRWHEVNRAVIGADPHLIRPGQRLHPPES